MLKLFTKLLEAVITVVVFSLILNYCYGINVKQIGEDLGYCEENFDVCEVIVVGENK